MSCQEYFERVRNKVDVIKSLGGSLADDMHRKDELPEREPRNGYTAEQLAGARKKIQNKTIAYGILVRADRSRYGKLIEEIENDFVKGNNDYPETPTEAYNLLVNYRSYNNQKRPINQGGLDHVAFLTEGKRQRGEGNESRYFPHIKCFKCNQMGHYKSDCPSGKKSKDDNNSSGETQEPAVTLTMTHVSLAVMKREREINPMWILCDSESTVDIFKNKSILMNIRKANKPIRLKGIEGKTIKIEEEGDLLGYGPVYCHEQVTANVLSLYNMAKRFKSIVYNSKMSDAFLVTRDDGTMMHFIPSAEGFHYYDFNISLRRHQEQQMMQNTMVVETVEELRRNYTIRELKQMDEARRLYVIMGRPPKVDFLQMLKKGKLLENPVRIEDFNNAERVYGKDLGVLKGKTIRIRPDRVILDTETVVKERLNIVLAVDIMNFTGLSFLVTVSRSIRFITTLLL